MASMKTIKPTKKGTKKVSSSSRTRQSGPRKTRVIETPNKWKRKKQKRRLKIAGILLAILLVLGGVLQFLEYRKEIAYRTAGIQYFQEEEYKKAQKQFELALEHKNIFGVTITQDIRYYLAESYFLGGSYERALNVYQEIRRKEKDTGYAECYIGACYAKLGDTEQAKREFEKGIELGNEEGYHYLSKMYYDLEDYEKAIEYETEFMKRREADGASYLLLARSYAGAGNFKKAIEVVEQGIALNDGRKQDLLFEEIVIYEKKLDFETAYQKCLQYVTKYPEDTIAKEELEFLETR